MPPSVMVMAYTSLRELDQVVKRLEKGIKERDLMVVSHLKYWQALDPVREH